MQPLNEPARLALGYMVIILILWVIKTALTLKQQIKLIFNIAILLTSGYFMSKANPIGGFMLAAFLLYRSFFMWETAQHNEKVIPK